MKKAKIVTAIPKKWAVKYGMDRDEDEEELKEEVPQYESRMAECVRCGLKTETVIITKRGP